MLVPDLLIGSVIGRGGDVVRRIRAETDARVKVFEARGAARPNQTPSSLEPGNSISC